MCLASIQAKRASCPGTKVADGCQPLCGCWELNPGSLEEQPQILHMNHLSTLGIIFLEVLNVKTAQKTHTCWKTFNQVSLSDMYFESITDTGWGKGNKEDRVIDTTDYWKER